ncbi:MAG: cupin domain-containing protein [Proteobacteria bacterium]|nr:cupin domain-containing protein [Pseudomonadota bacterium]
MSQEITHHPEDTTLVAFAAATLAEPLAAVVAAHVAMCPRCRQEVEDLERLGAALMLAQPVGVRAQPVEVPASVGQAPVRSEVRRVVASADRLPAPLAQAYGLTMENIAWRRLGPGVWHHRLALSDASEGDLRLLRISPGRTMPDHGHGGTELTLMLEGTYSDTTGHYRRGDVQDVDEDVEHQPVVGSEGDCICLIASVHPARFKSLIGRLTQPWTRL